MKEQPVPIERTYRKSWKASTRIVNIQVWTNPEKEGKIFGTRVGVHSSSCIACMKCIDVCPTDVFSEFQENNSIIVIPDAERECILCNACELVCPTDAISVIREGGSEETLDSLLRRTPEDK